MKTLSSVFVLLLAFATSTIADEVQPAPASEAPAAVSIDAATTALQQTSGMKSLLVVHPYTCCPVELCVCVPQCAKVCRVGCNKIKIDGPGRKNDTVIKFKRNGKVHQS